MTIDSHPCPTVPGATCLGDPCLGESRAGVCRHRAALAAWRAKPVDDQVAEMAARSVSTSTGFDSEAYQSLRLLVLGCDYRGPRLLCGCNGTRICLAGKGRLVPGTDAHDVTDSDCLDCVKGREPCF